MSVTADGLRVNILTPKKQFISDVFEAVVFTGLDGEIGVYKNHAPMFAAIDVGIIRLKKGGKWRNLVTDRGFAEVNANTLNIFSDMCEWAENVESAKAEIKRLRLAEKESLKQHRITEIELARAVSGFGSAGKKKKL